ncbi:uncharacterized protein LOC126385587 isoform X4 [Epinephelus moara]|uniref:uncharacterized protein LOC126385587 isoform X4 n=1 Tax=Epinephelus moara TaxID=300413 RepID=UPI00214E79F4|nr:uncharacterized protein LOC126385587 isoform X4 [Epinephelus moara]
MCSVESLREFVNERLTAAAEEILGVFQRSIVEYEEEIDRQRRLLDIVLKPEIKLHRTELPQQHVCKEEEVVPEQQLCIEERKSSVDQEEPEPPEIKEEEEEVCSSQEGEQLVVKQETDGFMLTPADEESEHSEDQTLDFIHDDTQSAAEKESVFKMPVISSVISEATSEHQLLSHNSHVAESQDEEEYQHGDSGSTRNTELQAEKRHHESEMNSNSPHTSAVINLNTETRNSDTRRLPPQISKKTAAVSVPGGLDGDASKSLSMQQKILGDIQTAWSWVNSHQDLFCGEVMEPGILQMEHANQLQTL